MVPERRRSAFHFREAWGVSSVRTRRDGWCAKEGSSPRSGTAEVVEGAEFEAIQAKVREKYGFQLKLINGVHSFQKLIRRGGHPNDCAVTVTLDDA